MDLQWIDTEKAVSRFNAWGTGDRPFFFLTDYLHRRWLVEPIDGLSADELLYAFPGHSNAPDEEAKARPLVWQPHPLTPEAYHEKFEIVHRNMLAGNSYLANLTCRIPLDTNLSLRDIFLLSQARYRLWVKDTFVCFSPETFVRIQDGIISSYPMKGTISCNVLNAEQTLLADVKEAAEHATIVDLIRNDLSHVADHVTVRRYRYVECLETCNGPILQTSSEIAGSCPLTIAVILATSSWLSCPPGRLRERLSPRPWPSSVRPKATSGASTRGWQAFANVDRWTAAC